VQNVAELKERLTNIQFDVVLTNPPFSMTKEAKNHSDKQVLEQYTLARRSPTSAVMRPSLRSSVMSIERYSELLRPVRSKDGKGLFDCTPTGLRMAPAAGGDSSRSCEGVGGGSIRKVGKASI